MNLRAQYGLRIITLIFFLVIHEKNLLEYFHHIFHLHEGLYLGQSGAEFRVHPRNTRVQGGNTRWMGHHCFTQWTHSLTHSVKYRRMQVHKISMYFYFGLTKQSLILYAGVKSQLNDINHEHGLKPVSCTRSKGQEPHKTRSNAQKCTIRSTSLRNKTKPPEGINRLTNQGMNSEHLDTIRESLVTIKAEV